MTKCCARPAEDAAAAAAARWRRPAFGEAEYYLAFLGTPSTTTPWMLQFGGHHLAINLTLAGSQATMTPSLPAAQPASYTVEGRTVRPLGSENDKAFALINALDATQRRQAILAYRVSDLVLGPGQDGQHDPAGRHPRVGAVARSRRCCSTSSASGPAS